MNEELIIRYVTGQSSDSESRELLAWVRRSPANEREFLDFCAVWYGSARAQRFDAQKAYAQFAQKVNITPEEHKTEQKGKIIQFWKPLVAIAAVALLFVGLFFFQRTEPHVEFVTIANTAIEPLHVFLPDSSEIILQQNAQVSYPAQFAANARNIEASGVLFCKIARNEQAPFTVNCKDFTVQVLGTEFEIETTAGNAHVIVEEGKVRVCNVATHAEVNVTAHERVDVEKNALQKSKNEDENFLSWSTGLLRFANTPLSTVFSDLQRHYKCTITVADSTIHTSKITGTYQNMELNDILEIIHSAFPQVHFTLSHNSHEITVHL
ncbi:MAG: FecR domain-containing protein [Bacteroidales bacterium]|jgi:ferric-dicitrate binding protein FerR (iron transport regulator)|nr:FecR domain-containing protein [Bacteroidales bacterium]